MVEFLWENRRFYDVRRWGIYEETEQEPIRGMNPDGATKETYYQRVIPSSSSFLTRVVDKRSVWVPIPRNEMRRLPSSTRIRVINLNNKKEDETRFYNDTRTYDSTFVMQ